MDEWMDGWMDWQTPLERFYSWAKNDMRWSLATSAQKFILNLPPPKIYSENNNSKRFTEVFSAHAHRGPFTSTTNQRRLFESATVHV
jgi:hypothetical protein